jgi:hypothetical protein
MPSGETDARQLALAMANSTPVALNRLTNWHMEK